jgi:hypothetical protein
MLENAGQPSAACKIHALFRFQAHFLAPKFVLFFVPVSVPLSSVSFFFLAFFVPAADVGVALAEPPSRKDADIGVGACEAGVEPGVSCRRNGSG